MNSEVHENKYALMGLGITIFVYFAFSGIYFFTEFITYDCKCPKRSCD